MRQYTGGPGRIVVVAVLADGKLDKHELDALGHHDVVRTLGMSRQDFDQIVRDFCEGMQAVSLCDYGDQLALDRVTTDQLLAEVDAPALQIKVLGIMLDIAAAYGRLAPSELTLVSQAMTRWGLALHAQSAHRDDLLPLANVWISGKPGPRCLSGVIRGAARALLVTR